MKVWFYMSDDGEVLSNRDFPVRSPEAHIVVWRTRSAIEYATEEQVTQCKIKRRIYRAHTIDAPLCPR